MAADRLDAMILYLSNEKNVAKEQSWNILVKKEQTAANVIYVTELQKTHSTQSKLRKYICIYKKLSCNNR